MGRNSSEFLFLLKKILVPYHKNKIKSLFSHSIHHLKKINAIIKKDYKEKPSYIIIVKLLVIIYKITTS